uniref:Uncharacterized protein n=1 Tax=Tanacetum cinerariifolium TaxID=118510 RepID=A0A699JN28_TANCI|nr:hypothetical protein [Tanacetum cinerariifolium]
MMLSPQHAGFGDQQEMLLIISPKTMDHTCLKDLTMLIFKADSSQQWLVSLRETNSLILYAGFFIIAVQTPGSGISILLAVGTPSTGSGNLYCQWELSPGSGNALCILFPTLISCYGDVM